MKEYTTEIYHENINDKTLNNDYFRDVIYTVPDSMQLVVMSVETEIPREKHSHTTQFIRVESGTGVVEIEYENGENKNYKLANDIAIIIPMGVYHRIKNTGKEPLKLYSIYTPPEHPSDRKEKKL